MRGLGGLQRALQLGAVGAVTFMAVEYLGASENTSGPSPSVEGTTAQRTRPSALQKMALSKM